MLDAESRISQLNPVWHIYCTFFIVPCEMRDGLGIQHPANLQCMAYTRVQSTGQGVGGGGGAPPNIPASPSDTTVLNTVATVLVSHPRQQWILIPTFSPK